MVVVVIVAKEIWGPFKSDFLILYSSRSHLPICAPPQLSGPKGGCDSLFVAVGVCCMSAAEYVGGRCSYLNGQCQGLALTLLVLTSKKLE